jgi:glycolate oxidase iron-sulfur subunit
MTRDIGEVLDAELARLEPLLGKPGPGTRIAFHPPCTLQHGQQIQGVVERVLVRAGFELTPVPDSHLCCGAAGTYSILQPELAEKLKRNKLSALVSGGPQFAVTANIGCQVHLAGEGALPVKHWIVALESRLR